jgi:hypothetical protein
MAGILRRGQAIFRGAPISGLLSELGEPCDPQEAF